MDSHVNSLISDKMYMDPAVPAVLKLTSGELTVYYGQIIHGVHLKYGRGFVIF